MDYKEIIDSVLSATDQRKHTVVTDVETRQALEKMKEFDVQNEWLPFREFTSMGKLIGAAVLKVYPDLLPQNDKRYRGWSVPPERFTPADLLTAYEAREPKRNLSSADVRLSESIFTTAKEMATLLKPLGERFELIRSRALKAGQTPKEERDRKKREEMVRAVDPKLESMIAELRDDWRRLIADYSLDALKLNREHAGFLLASLDWKPPVLRAGEGLEGEERYEVFSAAFSRYLKMGVIALSETGGGPKLPELRSDRDLAAMAEKTAVAESERLYLSLIADLGGFVNDLGKKVAAVSEAPADPPHGHSHRIGFEDGSSFSVASSLIPHRSPLITYSFKVNTDFRDVVNAKGEKINKPDASVVKAQITGQMERGQKR